LLSVEGFNEENMDKQLLSVAMQHDNLPAKVMAIKEFNKLKARIVEKIEHSGQITENIVLDPEREAIAKKVAEEIKKSKNL
jgi:CO dehydrogenase/acetyl-CoA synthase gamma subunit (corrinoid Fe-S protein)